MVRLRRYGPDVLEEIVDDNGLDAVLSMLSDICYEKAEHIQHVWQDDGLARQWDKAGDILDVAAQRTGVLGLGVSQ